MVKGELSFVCAPGCMMNSGGSRDNPGACDVGRDVKGCVCGGEREASCGDEWFEIPLTPVQSTKIDLLLLESRVLGPK